MGLINSAFSRWFTFGIGMGESEKISWRLNALMLWRIAQNVNDRMTCSRWLIALSLAA